MINDAPIGTHNVAVRGLSKNNAIIPISNIRTPIEISPFFFMISTTNWIIICLPAFKN